MRVQRTLRGRGSILGSVALAWVLVAPSAAGQATVSSPEGRGTQFVFVVDDSRSMREKLRGETYAAADPDRLSVFAVEALLSMLDPQDEATVVRLNGPFEGETQPPIEPLTGGHRARLQKHLAGKLADYAGDFTPCRSALEATARLLAAAHRDNVAQVVFVLTDGKCTGRDDQVPNPHGFLAGVESHRQGLFRFYLLRFESRPFTAELAELAKTTGGQAITVSGDDPTGILAPFADALTRSQGYEAELLTAAEPQLAAHLGARRVRLLAVAPGKRSGLAFRIADPQGKSPRAMRTPPAGVFQHGNGRPYSYLALDYAPTRSPMTVRVDGADNAWKVVAVPEYRLAVSMRIFDGLCDAPGSAIEHGTKAGRPVCAVLRLVNERGQPVERDGVGGELEAEVTYTRCREPPQTLAANSRGDLAEFTFERQRLESCDHLFVPRMHLTLPGHGERISLVGAKRSIEASSLDMRVEPASLDFGRLRPGGESAPLPIELRGNFPQSPGLLEVQNRDALPSCITFSLNGNAEANAVTLAPGGHYTLVAKLSPFCGPDSFEQRFDPRLRLTLAEGGSSAEIATSVSVEYRFELPQPVTVSVDAGGSAEVRLPFGGNQVHPFDMDAVLEATDPNSGWPRDDLLLGFAATDGGIERDDGATAGSKIFTLDPASAANVLQLRVEADRCCAGGVYETHVGLVQAGGDYSGELPRPVSVPLRVEVRPAGFWACRGNAILWGLVLLLLALLVAYVVTMFRHSSFLAPDRLADSLVPLRWDNFGETQKDPRLATEVRAMARQGLPLKSRVASWFAANPLRFGLPGGRRYEETAELFLQPERAVDRSSLRIDPGGDRHRKLGDNPASGAGRLFARAVGRGGIEFFGTPLRGRFGRLSPARLVDFAGGEDQERKPRLLSLKRREKLIHSIPVGERQEGQAAGWQVG